MMDFVKVPKKRILLTEEDFTTIVSGNILVKEGVEIALQDIGFDRMKSIIDSRRNVGIDNMSTEELIETARWLMDVRPTL